MRKPRELTDKQVMWLSKFRQRGRLQVLGASNRRWLDTDLGKADTPMLANIFKLTQDGLLTKGDDGIYVISALGGEKLDRFYDGK